MASGILWRFLVTLAVAVAAVRPQRSHGDLHTAAAKGQTAAIAVLVADGEDVNERLGFLMMFFFWGGILCCLCFFDFIVSLGGLSWFSWFLDVDTCVQRGRTCLCFL